MPFNRKLEPTKSRSRCLDEYSNDRAREGITSTENNVRLNAIGNIGSLPEKANKKLISVINATSGNDGLTLTLALSYGSQDEMVQAIRKVALEVAEGKLTQKA